MSARGCAGSTRPSGRCWRRLAGELKDPRVGFVTVTDVETSPDLRHARVYVSVLGDPGGARGDAGRACARPTASSSGAWRRAAPQAHAELDFVYDDTAERAAARRELLDDGRRRA